jgi:hypothetical protein
VLGRIERDRVDREREIASLVDLVREALVDIDDRRHLKLLLVKKVRALKKAMT